jgi:hypothetical protein
VSSRIHRQSVVALPSRVLLAALLSAAVTALAGCSVGPEDDAHPVPPPSSPSAAASASVAMTGGERRDGS